MADGVAITAGSGTTILTDDTGAGGHAQVVKLAIATDGSATLIPADGTDGLLVNLGANNDVTVAGVATAANQTTIIGHVDGIETVLGTIDADTSTLAGAVSGTEMQVDVVTMPNVTLAAGTNTNEVVGDVAHDAALAGNPIVIAGAAQNTDDTAPPNRVSAEGDATRIATDWDGAVFVRPHGPQIWSYHLDTSTAQTDASVHAAPGAGLSLYVTDIIISLGAATALNVFFEEGASKVLGPYYLEAINGRGMHIKFGTPKKVTANTALTVTTSASVAHCVDVTGFTAPG